MVLSSIAIASACGGSESPAVDQVDVAVPPPPSASIAVHPAEPEARRASATSEPIAEAGESTGYPECDAFLDQLVRCAENHPESAEAFQQARDAWLQVPKDLPPEARKSLIDGCRTAAQAMETGCR
jgi:hypothetical protein